MELTKAIIRKITQVVIICFATIPTHTVLNFYYHYQHTHPKLLHLPIYIHYTLIGVGRRIKCHLQMLWRNSFLEHLYLPFFLLARIYISGNPKC